MTTPADPVRLETEMTRRRMLMRLGLAATAIYAAPTVLQLSEAKASGMSRGSFSGSFSGGRSSSSHSSGQPLQHPSPRRRRRRRRWLFWSFSR